MGCATDADPFNVVRGWRKWDAGVHRCAVSQADLERTVISLSADIAASLIAHARAEAPNECCGVIGGRDGRATAVHRATNTAASPVMYAMDSQEQMRLLAAIEAAGDDLLGIYHLHTRSAAVPSRTDVQLAFFRRALYVIISLADANAPVIRAFYLRREKPYDEAITEVPVVIDSSTSDPTRPGR